MPRLLTQWLAGDERFEIGEHLAGAIHADQQPEPFLGRAGVDLLEPPDLDAAVLIVDEVLVWHASPQRQPVLDPIEGARRIIDALRHGVPDGPLERIGIERRRR